MLKLFNDGSPLGRLLVKDYWLDTQPLEKSRYVYYADTARDWAVRGRPHQPS